MNANNKTNGTVMTLVGFVLILINATLYFTRGETLPVLGIIGLVLVATGISWAKKD
jgi:hypothetical protein